MSIIKALEKIKEAATELVSLDKAKEDEQVKLAQETLENGTVIEAESFEAGQPVFIVNEDERVALPVGDYEWDGKVLVVAEEGMIAEINEKAMEEEAPEVEAEAEYVTKEEFNTAIDSIKAMFSKDQDEVKAELKKSEDKVVELQKEIDNKPDATSIKHAPKKKVELKEVRATTKKGRILQALNKTLN